MKIGVIASSLSRDPRQAGPVARQLGVDGLLFDAYGPTLSLPELSQTGRREFMHMVRGHDRQIVGLRMDLGTDGLGPKADVDQKLSKIERALDAARGLNAPLVCVDLGPLPAPAVTTPTKPRVTQDMAGLILLPGPADVAEAAPPPPQQSPADGAFISHLDPVLTELGRRADRYGVMLAFSSGLASLAALDRAVQAARCPWFGVDLDAVAVLGDAWDLDEAFARLGGLISHVRARDAVQGTAGRAQPALIGQGSVNWPHLLANLDAAGYQGWITIDPLEMPDRLGAVRTSVRLLRQKE